MGHRREWEKEGGGRGGRGGWGRGLDKGEKKH